MIPRYNRVVITGVGVVSSIGNDYATVTESLKAGKSGTRYMQEWEEDFGLTSAVAGPINLPDEKIKAAGIPKKLLRAMSPSVLFCGVAANDAVMDSGLSAEELSDARTACIVGNGVADVNEIYDGATKAHAKRISRIGPYSVIKSMSSTASAVLTKQFGVTGRSYSISSACATSTHNIGHAYELIRHGMLDRAITGGCEEVNPLISGSFHGLRMALSSGFNDRPESASRPYDSARDGFVISGGAGVAILESYESAMARNAKIYGEIIGYAANSDPFDLVLPQAEGGTFIDCIELAIKESRISKNDIDAINTHGTGTYHGDIAEINGLKQVFGELIPMYSSTKSMTGHGIGAAGAIELIACLSMMEHGYMAPSINIENIDPMFADTPVVREPCNANINTMMTLNFGFGGTNAAMLLRSV